MKKGEEGFHQCHLAVPAHIKEMAGGVRGADRANSAKCYSLF